MANKKKISPRNDFIIFRVNKEERKSIQAKAKAGSMSLPTYIRTTLGLNANCN